MTTIRTPGACTLPTLTPRHSFYNIVSRLNPFNAFFESIPATFLIFCMVERSREWFWESYQDTDQVCNFEFDISFPVCHAVQSYSSVNVSNVEVPLNFSCSDLEILDWDNFQVNNVSIMIIYPRYRMSRFILSPNTTLY